MTSFEIHAGVETLTAWLRDQQRAISVEAEALTDAEPADAVARLILGVLFAGAGYLLIKDATAVSTPLLVGYALAGRASATVVGLVAMRVGVPRTLSGLRTIKKIRSSSSNDQDVVDVEGAT